MTQRQIDMLEKGIKTVIENKTLSETEKEEWTNIVMKRGTAIKKKEIGDDIKKIISLNASKKEVADAEGKDFEPAPEEVPGANMAPDTVKLNIK